MLVWITVLVFMGSMVLAGRMAHARRRSIKAWVWVAAIVGPIGPLALYLLAISPTRHLMPKGHA
jgi:hypothetical protein